MIDFDIISTGSKGNAVMLGDGQILVDVGVPFKMLQPHFRKFRLALLSHIHGDHFNKSTIRKLALERSTLRFGCCNWLVAPLVQCGVEKRQIDVYTPGHCFVYAGFCTVKPERMIHDVPNVGYHIWKGNQAIFYATDTNSVSHVDAKGYGLYLLEANYTQRDIYDRIKEKQQQGVYCYEHKVLHNHLSKEKAEEWLYSNMSSDSRYVFLHGHVD